MDKGTSSATIGIHVGANNGDGVFTGVMKNTSGTLTFTKSGSGTQSLSGTGITYTGATTVNSGVLNLTNTTGFASTITMNGGTLELTNNDSFATWNFARIIAAGSGPGNVKIASSGAVTLSGANTFTGTTIIDSGILTVTGSIAASPLIDLLYNGTLSDSTVTSGQTLRGNGILNNVTFSNGSTLTPGAAGSIDTIDCTGFVNMQAGSTCVMQVNRTVGGSITSDKLSAANDLTYGGTLTVTATGSSFTAGNIVSLFPSADIYRGSFTALNLPTLTSGLSWDLSGLTVNGSIKVVSTLPTPIFNPPAGGYIGAQSVSISSEVGSTIYYTVDGSTPTISSPNGPSPITGVNIASDTTVTIKAFAKKSGKTDSPIGTATYNTLNSAVWILDYNGSWSLADNWEFDAIPQGSGVSADFSTLEMTGLNTVSLDGLRTTGRLIFGDVTNQYGWTIVPGTGGTLLLDNGVNPPVIDVKNQSATISAVMTSTTGLTVASSIYEPANGGTGTLILSAANSISGPVTITGGTLQLGNPNSIASGSAVTLGSSGSTNATLYLANGAYAIGSLTVAS
ncbi:MAG TPA: chitobiase/beta-hexosaminidase C-terminal domain-containing protein, partial [Luteolibacter sp.]